VVEVENGSAGEKYSVSVGEAQSSARAVEGGAERAEREGRVEAEEGSGSGAGSTLT
jgi:hypothetical protein